MKVHRVRFEAHSAEPLRKLFNLGSPENDSPTI